MVVPSVKEVIFFKSEMNALRAEAMLDLYVKSKKNVFTILFDIDGSRKIREKGILLRLEVIHEVLRFVELNLETDEKVFWYGNDEIMVIIEANNTETAMKKANTIREKISQHYIDIKEPVEQVEFSGHITVTGGLVAVSEYQDVNDIIRTAKSRIALAKEQGRNCIDSTAKEQLIPFRFKMTTIEQEQLLALSEKRERTVGSLLREAVDTLLLHYPQFHGHRKDREKKMPQDAFTYACTPVVANKN